MDQIISINTKQNEPVGFFSISVVFGNGLDSLTLPVGLDVQEGSCETTKASISISITPNPPPEILEPVNQVAVVGKTHEYTLPTGFFSDPEDEVLSLTATKDDDSALPAFISFSTSETKFTVLSMDNSEAGLYSLKVSASDGATTVSKTF